MFPTWIPATISPNVKHDVCICRVNRSKFLHFLCLQHKRSGNFHIYISLYQLIYVWLRKFSWEIMVDDNFPTYLYQWNFRFGWTYTPFQSLDLVVRRAPRYLKKLGVTHQLVLVAVLVWVARKILTHAWMNLRQVPCFGPCIL